MTIPSKVVSIFMMLTISLVFSQCKTNQHLASDEPLKEIAPGLLQGYLSIEEIPNSLALIPPPPEEGSVAFALDQEFASKAVASKDTARFTQATTDAELHFPAAAQSFESTVGIEISETKMPKLYVLMRRVLTDAALTTYTAKNHYKRPRPFMVNNTPTCTPEDEALLRKDGSYPY